MGTRNLVCIQNNNKIVVAKYCQWDGYPEGQGAIILNFICNGFDRDLLEKKLEDLSEITDAEYKGLWVECGADPESNLVNMEVSEKFEEKYPHLQRDMGGRLIEFIQDHEGELKISSDASFSHNSLMCEYGYVVNLDDNTLDFFRGFNNDKPEKSIFFDPETDEVNGGEFSDSDYFPIRLADSYTFNEIIEQGVDRIVEKMKTSVRIIDGDEE